MELAIRWTKGLWFGAGVLALLYVIAGYWQGTWTTREPSIGLLGILVLLSVPIGLAGIFALGLLSDAVSGTPLDIMFSNAYVEATVTWACLSALGWWQWFVLLPWLVRAIRNRFGSRGQRAA